MGYFGIPFRNGVPIGLGSVVSFGAQQFDPSELFVGGTAGAWYDPSDLSTMFDTSTGTTPVAMPGLGAPVPVGLMLDKSQGLVLGSELISGAASAYTGNGTVSTVGDTVTATCTASGVYGIRWNASTISNIWTRCVFEVVTNSASKSLNFYPNLVHPGVTVGTTTGGKTYTLLAPTASGGNQVPVFFINGLVGESFSIRATSIRELAGNHAIAFNNTTARPELRARVNLLEYSEQFDNGVWQKNDGSSVTPNAVAAPDGTTTADQINLGSSELSRVQQAISLSATADYGFAVWLRTVSGTESIRFGHSANLDSITVTDQWQRFVVTKNVASPNTPNLTIRNSSAGGAKTIYAWGSDLRPANIGANVPAYQRIADANTYDTSGFPLYLLFDGIDDSMYTPASIPFATVTSDGQARRNLLLNPTQFDAAAWTASNLTVTANTTGAPDGTTTADTLDDASASFGALSQIVSSLANSAYNFSVYIKSSGVASDVRIDLYTTVGEQFFAIFNSGTGAYVSGNGVIYTTTSVGNGWYRVSLSASGSGNTTVRVYPAGGSAGATGSIYIWGAQLELGSTATAFQNIGTDKVAVFAGVRKLSDAAGGSVVETIPNYTATGAFGVFSPDASSPSRYSFGMTAAVGAQVGATPANYAAPITSVLQSSMDLSQLAYAGLTARVNGQSVALSYGGAGVVTAGNFGTRPMCIGSRDNASFRFNGHLHSLIIAGSAVSAGNISATESWVAGRTGIQI